MEVHLEPEEASIARLAHRNIERLIHRPQQYPEYCKIDTGQLELPLETVLLSDTIKDAVALTIPFVSR